jgi:hypothetical protein
MSGSDVLDRNLYLQFAWRTAATLSSEDAASPSAPALEASLVEEAPKSGPGEDEEGVPREVAPDVCEKLARQVEFIWRMTSRVRQAAATHLLLSRYAPALAGFSGMEKHPRASVRLWRLGVRHARKLGVEGRRILCRMPILVHEPEVVDLLVELVGSEDRELLEAIGETDAIELVGRRFPALGARLGEVFEHGGTWAARESAMRWMLRAGRSAAAESLRRALRRPLLRLRRMALEQLSAMEPSPLTVEDVDFLLRDALVHPLPSMASAEVRRDGEAYAEALLEAVRRTPPPEGWRAVEALAKRRIDGVHDLLPAGLGRDWALVALAAGWPQKALQDVDRALAGNRWPKRAGLEALRYLPDELARPRLREAATLPHPRESDHAKTIWQERYGEACVVGPLEGVPVELLDGPPSEALIAQIAALRATTSGQAVKELAAAALAAAPAREALVLLAYGLRSFTRAYAQGRLTMLPPRTDHWARTILGAFGAAGFDALLTLAAREAPAGHPSDGWLAGLSICATSGTLSPEQQLRLRTLAADLVLGPETGDAQVPSDAVLERAGASVVDPPSADFDEADLDEEEEDAPSEPTAWLVLEGLRQSPEIERWMLDKADEALAAQRWAAVGEILNSGLHPRSKGLHPVARRLLDAAERDPAALQGLVRCQHMLRKSGFLDLRWLIRTLARPSSPLFRVAAEVVNVRDPHLCFAALEAALDAPDRGGEPAAWAAHALLTLGRLPPDDPRLDGILSRAPAPLRLKLIAMLLDEGAELPLLAPHLRAAMLTKSAPEGREALLLLTNGRSLRGAWELLESVLASGPIEEVRRAILRHMGEPSEEEVYWRELGEEDEDGAEER